MSQQAQSTNQADVEAINKVREMHIAAVNDGDVDAWVGTFTDDGVQMPPNVPANLGSERIREWSQPSWLLFVSSLSSSLMKFRRQVAGRLKGALTKST